LFVTVSRSLVSRELRISLVRNGFGDVLLRS
jgi:hypothetical protein